MLQPSSRQLLSPAEVTLDVESDFEIFKSFLKSLDPTDELLTGYHFVDILLSKAETISIPKFRIKSYLTDLSNPKRFVGLDDTDGLLDNETCAQLDVTITVVGPGRESKFLPEV